MNKITTALRSFGPKYYLLSDQKSDSEPNEKEDVKEDDNAKLKSEKRRVVFINAHDESHETDESDESGTKTDETDVESEKSGGKSDEANAESEKSGAKSYESDAESQGSGHKSDGKEVETDGTGSKSDEGEESEDVESDGAKVETDDNDNESEKVGDKYDKDDESEKAEDKTDEDDESEKSNTESKKSDDTYDNGSNKSEKAEIELNKTDVSNVNGVNGVNGFASKLSKIDRINGTMIHRNHDKEESIVDSDIKDVVEENNKNETYPDNSPNIDNTITTQPNNEDTEEDNQRAITPEPENKLDIIKSTDKYPTCMQEVFSMLDDRWSTESKDDPPYNLSASVDDMDFETYMEYNMNIRTPIPKESWERFILISLKVACACVVYKLVSDMSQYWDDADYW